MKILLHNKFKYEWASVLTKALQKLGDNNTLEDNYVLLGDTPNPKMGDLAFPLFSHAKNLKKSPVELAKALEASLKESTLPDFIEKTLTAGPYLNCFFKTASFAQIILPDINSTHFFKTKLTENMPKTMVEYSQPNTHKELHVGHMRNLCLGDSLIKMHRYVGCEIVSSTFPGDVGTHVAKCLWYLKYCYQGSTPEVNKGAWLGSMYTKAYNQLENERNTPKEEENKKQLTEILAQLEKKSGPFFDLWKETRQWSVELMNEVYKWAQVNFDVWFWESEVDSDSVKLIKSYYEKGLFVKSEGAIGADLNEHKLGFCLLIKSDGNGLYATKDVELARRKFQEYKIEKSIYVVDARQSHHFEQVFKILELMQFPHAKDCFHLAYDFVELPEGAMSSRKGNIVPLQALIDQMVHTIKTEYLSRYEKEWSAEDIHKTAHQVARGAIKYGMTRIDPNKKIVFDMKEWLKLDGESGPYLQYTHARIKTMLAKIPLTVKADYSKLVMAQEKSLLYLLPQFNEVVVEATLKYRPSHLTAYLFDVARAFNAFYAECPLSSAGSGLKEARCELAGATAKIISHGLNLLGIEAIERM